MLSPKAGWALEHCPWELWAVKPHGYGRAAEESAFSTGAGRWSRTWATQYTGLPPWRTCVLWLWRPCRNPGGHLLQGECAPGSSPRARGHATSFMVVSVHSPPRGRRHCEVHHSELEEASHSMVTAQARICHHVLKVIPKPSSASPHPRPHQECTLPQH